MIFRKCFILQVILIGIQLSLAKSSLPPGFNRPSPQNELQKLKISLNEVKETLEELKSISKDNKTNKQRIGNLESETEYLQKQLDNENRINKANQENIRSTIDDFKRAMESLRSQVDKLKQDFEEKQKLQGPSLLRYAIINDIKGSSFDSASERLGNLTGKLQTNINNIVFSVYDNDVANFDMILAFGNGKNMNETTKLAVYKALYHQMERNNDNNYRNILQLLKNLNDGVINQNLTSANDQQSATDLQNSMHNVVKGIVVVHLMHNLNANNYTAVSDISKDIFMTYPTLFKEVISESVNKAFDAVDTKDLINFFINHRYQTQSVFGLSAVFNELKTRNNLDQPEVITLAIGLRNAIVLSRSDVSSSEEGNRVKEMLPTSVRNLAFSNRVCIKSKKYNEYLFAPGDEFKESNARRVFTSVPQQNDSQHIWSIIGLQNEDDEFVIKNVFYQEFLFSAVRISHTVIPIVTRKVFTSIAGSYMRYLHQTPHWMFAPSGNDVYIKPSKGSPLHTEYLYAAEDLFNENSRHVYYMPHSTGGNSLWIIENCDNNSTAANTDGISTTSTNTI